MAAFRVEIITSLDSSRRWQEMFYRMSPGITRFNTNMAEVTFHFLQFSTFTVQEQYWCLLLQAIFAKLRKIEYELRVRLSVPMQ